MSRFLPISETKTVNQAYPDIERKQRFFSSGSRAGSPYKDGWNIERAFTGMQQVVWVYRAVDAIASNAARIPAVLRAGDRRTGETITADVLQLLNTTPNPYENAASFRYRLSSQLLLNKQGAFIEKVATMGGDTHALYLLPPQSVSPIVDPDTFVSGYVVKVQDKYGRTVDKPLKPEQVIWIKKPHPFDAYTGITPLESSGLAIEIDYFAKQYNRTFLANDGRPGGLLMVNGNLTEDDAKELEQRFSGGAGRGPSMAGRTSVLEGNGQMSYVDLASTPRDAQYSESREEAKNEILLAFGVPESVIGSASGRTYDNANAELTVFWRETMLPHLDLIARGFDVLDPDPEVFVGWDFSEVAVLGQDERARNRFYLEEMLAEGITRDEYRVLTNRDPIDDGSDNASITDFLRGIAALSDEDEEIFDALTRITGGDASHAEGVLNSIRKRFEALGGNADELFARLRKLPKMHSVPEKWEEGQKRPRNDSRVARAAKSIAMANLDIYLDRQKSVIKQKASGAKAKKLVADGKSIPTNVVYNKQLWDDQLSAAIDTIYDVFSKNFDIEWADTDIIDTKIVLSDINSKIEQYIDSAENKCDVDTFFDETIRPVIDDAINDLVEKMDI